MTDPTVDPAVKFAERFWSKVEKSDGCWLWVAATVKTPDGHRYGRFHVSGRGHWKLAHVVAYELAVGPVPPGFEIDHRCHQTLCMNPAHLQAVTHKENGENRAGPNRNNKSSGIRGVTRKDGRWVGQVMHNGRNYHVGVFTSIKEAEAAVINKRAELFTNTDLGRPV